jgi:hypothetical protein
VLFFDLIGKNMERGGVGLLLGVSRFYGVLVVVNRGEVVVDCVVNVVF